VVAGELKSERNWVGERKTAREEEKDRDIERENRERERGGGLGSRPKKMYGERLGDGVEYHLMSPTPRP